MSTMTLFELPMLLGKHERLVVALPVARAIVMAIGRLLFIHSTYTVSTSMYVLASSTTDNFSALPSDLMESQMLTIDVAMLRRWTRVIATRFHQIDYRASARVPQETGQIRSVQTTPTVSAWPAQRRRASADGPQHSILPAHAAWWKDQTARPSGSRPMQPAPCVRDRSDRP